jgi:hypothetical protein
MQYSAPYAAANVLVLQYNSDSTLEKGSMQRNRQAAMDE